MGRGISWEELKSSISGRMEITKEEAIAGGSLEDMEEEVRELGREIGRDMLEYIVQEREEIGIGEIRCERCGGEVKRNGRVRRKIKTMLGEIEIERQRVRCKRCGRDFFPSG